MVATNSTSLKYKKPPNPWICINSGFFNFSWLVRKMLLHRTNKHFFGKNALVLYVKTPQFKRIMVFYPSLYYIFGIFTIIRLEFTSLCCFLDGHRYPWFFGVFKPFGCYASATNSIYLRLTAINWHYLHFMTWILLTNMVYFKHKRSNRPQSG